ncbi:MAG TPA: GNAT family N-acetyltransferase [Nitrososphaerales archaeon]|nr:GNAT family N-acetyltransferase [Nitrososphaerales archaeon]
MSKKSSIESTNESARRQKADEGRKKPGVIIREIKRGEEESAGELIGRLKRLNGEFDPLLKTSSNLEAEARSSIKSAMSNKDSVVLVAVQEEIDKVVGVVKADLIDRVFYEPRKEGAIVEFYILPEFRRGDLGNKLLASMVDALKAKGAVLITAEFPSQNEIAKKFYTKLGFRSLTNVYAKSY